MALFFDQAWFDVQLKARGATQDDVARLLNLTRHEVGEMWKDQRELKASEVLALAKFLKVTPAEIAARAGISTPVPDADASVNERLDEMNERLKRVERMIVELKTLILTPRS